MSKTISINQLTKNFIKSQAVLGVDGALALIKKAGVTPELFKETFQIIVFCTGMQQYMRKELFVSQPKPGDFPDYKARTIDDHFFQIENLRVPEILAQSKLLNEADIAQFIYEKKPPHELNDVVLAVYGDFARDELHLDKLAENVSRLYNSKDEIWFYTRVSPNENIWLMYKLNPLDPQIQFTYKPFA